MIITKYRMIFENGCIETLDEKEAIAYGNYVKIIEEIKEKTDGDNNTTGDSN